MRQAEVQHSKSSTELVKRIQRQTEAAERQRRLDAAKAFSADPELLAFVPDACLTEEELMMRDRQLNQLLDIPDPLDCFDQWSDDEMAAAAAAEREAEPRTLVGTESIHSDSTAELEPEQTKIDEFQSPRVDDGDSAVLENSPGRAAGQNATMHASARQGSAMHTSARQDSTMHASAGWQPEGEPAG